MSIKLSSLTGFKNVIPYKFVAVCLSALGITSCVVTVVVLTVESSVWVVSKSVVVVVLFLGYNATSSTW